VAQARQDQLCGGSDFGLGKKIMMGLGLNLDRNQRDWGFPWRGDDGWWARLAIPEA